MEARYRIPVPIVIANNATCRQLKLIHKLLLGGYYLDEKRKRMELDDAVMNFSLLAQSMGVRKERIGSMRGQNPLLKNAIDSKKPRPLEVLTENNPLIQ